MEIFLLRGEGGRGVGGGGMLGILKSYLHTISYTVTKYHLYTLSLKYICTLCSAFAKNILPLTYILSSPKFCFFFPK